jgi:hypothetical protein
MITLWIRLDRDILSLRGKIDAGSHVPYTKYSHEVVIEFGSPPVDGRHRDDEDDFFVTEVTEEQRRALERKLSLKPMGRK